MQLSGTRKTFLGNTRWTVPVCLFRWYVNEMLSHMITATLVIMGWLGMIFVKENKHTHRRVYYCSFKLNSPLDKAFNYTESFFLCRDSKNCLWIGNPKWSTDSLSSLNGAFDLIVYPALLLEVFTSHLLKSSTACPSCFSSLESIIMYSRITGWSVAGTTFCVMKQFTIFTWAQCQFQYIWFITDDQFWLIHFVALFVGSFQQLNFFINTHTGTVCASCLKQEAHDMGSIGHMLRN